MANLSNALKELQAERSRARVQIEKLDQAISVIESLNGAGVSRTANSRVVSAASRRGMARAQRARGAKLRKAPQSAGRTGARPPKRPWVRAARRKIPAGPRPARARGEAAV